MKSIIRYSEAFKRQIVKEYESGKYSSIKELREKYGINGQLTIQRWLKKYGKQHLLPKKVRIEMPKERDEKRELKKRIKQLEKALSQAKVEAVINQAYFEILCEETGITDKEAFKKKAEGKLWKEEK